VNKESFFGVRRQAERYILMNRITDDEECDATKGDSSTDDNKIKIFQKLRRLVDSGL
jgi:hypothetical protein